MLTPSTRKATDSEDAIASSAASEALNLESMRQVAEAAARKAGEIQRDHFNSPSLTVVDNQTRDLKIEVDRLSETAICEHIAGTYPDHGIVSEESGQKTGDSRLVWIIDPLDGTLNYYFGIPLFCSCVACFRLPQPMNAYPPGSGFRYLAQAEPLVGVVYAPMLQRMYSATAGQGAMCNGEPIQTPAGRPLKDAMVGISFGSDDAVMRTMEALNARLVRQVKKVRIYGSTGLDLAHVAMGHLSALIQLKVRIWDIAAALVILKACGVVYEVQPGPYGGWQIIAAMPPLFERLKEILDSAKHLT